MDFSLEACKFLVPDDISSLGMGTKDRCEQLGNQNITSIEREDSSWNQHFRTWKWMVDGWKTGCPLKKMVPWNCWWNKSIITKISWPFPKDYDYDYSMVDLDPEGMSNDNLSPWATNQSVCKLKPNLLYLRAFRHVCHTVDGSNPANLLRLVVYPHNLKGFSTIPGG